MFLESIFLCSISLKLKFMASKLDPPIQRDNVMMNDTQRIKMEALIEELETQFKMSRKVAITALTIKDEKRIQAEMETQVPGISFAVAFPTADMAIHQDDVAKITQFLEGVSSERAKELVAERFKSGLLKAESKH